MTAITDFQCIGTIRDSINEIILCPKDDGIIYICGLSIQRVFNSDISAVDADGVINIHQTF